MFDFENEKKKKLNPDKLKKSKHSLLVQQQSKQKGQMPQFGSLLDSN